MTNITQDTWGTTHIEFQDVNAMREGFINYFLSSTGKHEVRIIANDTPSTGKTFVFSSGGYALFPYRTTGLINTDVITKGNLEGSDHTFTGINTVPKPANTTASTSNQIASVAYVNDATEGVNNLAHKSGNETIHGDKTYVTGLTIYKSNIDTGWLHSRVWYSSQDYFVGQEVTIFENNQEIKLTRLTNGGTSWGGLALIFDNTTGNITLRMEKNINGSYVSHDIYTL